MTAPMDEAVRVEELGKRFIARSHPSEDWALRDACFSVKRGEAVGVVGRNGVGKSVLLGLIAGLIKPTEGSALAFGRVQLLLQMTQRLDARLSVAAYARLCAIESGLDPEFVEDRLGRILRFSGLEERRDDEVGELSTGLRARIPFSAALHADIDVFLIDEMNLVGDELFRDRCLVEMERLRDGGKTFLVAAHEGALIARFCRRCLILEGGRLVADGPAPSTVRRYLEGLGVPAGTSAASAADREAMANYAAAQRLLPERLAAAGFPVVAAEPATDDDLLRVHSRDWLSRLKANDLEEEEEEAWSLPYSREILPLSWRKCGGTLLACRRALASGAGIHLGGGLHHAVATHGRGYCAVNDVAVALRALMSEGRVLRPLIVDLDAHQGDGTARLFAAEPSVYTFSMHNMRAFPLRKAVGSLDVELEPGVGDAAYLSLLSRHLAYAFEVHSPDFVVYVAGADSYARDPIGGLGLSLDGLARRDRDVFSAAAAHDVSIAVVAGGGYGPFEDLIAIRLGTVAAAFEFYPAAERLVVV